MGLLEELAEDARAADAAAFLGSFGPDDRYWQDLAYVFVLHVGPTQFRFPLVLAPKRYEVTFPFARTITPAQEGGMNVERQGIVLGKLMIAGDTGVRVRAIDDVPVPLSGQAHFLRLFSECFDRYSDLCKDPTISANVVMTFHSFRDNHHFVIEPDAFRGPREASRRVHYPYEITADILGPAEDVTPKALEDDGVISSFKDAAKQILQAAGIIRAFLDDATNLHTEINAAFTDVQSGLDAVGGIPLTLETNIVGDLERTAGVINEFNRGVTRIIGMPRQAVLDLSSAIADLNSALAFSATIPEEVIQGFRQTEDALLAIAAHPEKFTDPWSDAAKAYTDLTRGAAGSPQSEIDAAAPATSMQQLRGTAVQPGDASRISSGALRRDDALPDYQGFREYVIRFGDTLAIIAARELGDARRWIDIAIANDLRAPFIAAGFPDCVEPGDSIVIPTLTTGVTPATVVSAGNPTLGASQLAALFGTDFRLEQDVNGLFDRVVDVANGSTDFQKVSGVANVEQAILIIVSTEKGSNPLYLLLGIDIAVGKPGTFNRLINAQLSASQGLLRDPRIERISKMRFRFVRDAAAYDIEIVLVNKIQTRTIARVAS